MWLINPFTRPHQTLNYNNNENRYPLKCVVNVKTSFACAMDHDFWVY